jgi:UDP-xylose/UDP-N-acetylglucosamine transporter B4
MAELNRATLLALLPEWSLTLSLIFVGCCSNAFYLESATRIQPACGTLMTFVQFICTTIQMLPTQLEFRRGLPGLRTPSVPLSRWSMQVMMYFAVTLLNNTAFSFHVPVPVHIIFRSGGLVVSMLAGYLIRSRRYSPTQIASVVLVTVGVIVSTLATTPEDGGGDSASGGSAAEYFAGIGLLIAALILSSVMGLYQEETYGKYGKQHWQEGLFYNHFLSLPLFALRYGTLANEWQMARNDKRMWIGWGCPNMGEQASALRHNFFTKSKSQPSTIDMLRLAPDAVYDLRSWLAASVQAISIDNLPRGSFGMLVPILLPALAMNCLTQLVCVNGVNRLTAMCSSLTVTLILVIRKAVSLAISVLIVAPSMGEEVKGKAMLFCGATMVLLGTIGYALGSTADTSDKKDDEKRISTTSAEKHNSKGQSTAIDIGSKTTNTSRRTRGSS